MRVTGSSRVVAARYARALLSVVLDKEADLDRVAGELRSMGELMTAEPRLAEVLSNPTIAPEKRVKVLEEVVASQELTPYTLNLLRLLTRKERMPILQDVSDQFQRLVLEHKRIQSGDVVSAHPLTGDQQKRLSDSLGQALGGTMELSYRTDPELVGGLVVRIGNRVYDASVITQLRRFKEKALLSL